MSPTDSLLGTSLVRRAAYAVGLIALFGIAFGFTWSQTIIVAAIVLAGESAELASPLPGLDERHFRLALGLVVVAAVGSPIGRRETPPSPRSESAAVAG